MKLIQYTDTYHNKTDAINSFDFLKTQIDFKGGRVLPPTPKGWWVESEPRKEWKIQVFFSAEGISDEWLPDNCRLVTVLRSQFALLGIEPE